MRYSHIFSLHAYIFLYLYRLLCQSLALDASIENHPLWYLRNIEWHCIDWVLVLFRYAIAKYVLWCFDKKWHDHLPIYLIANIIPSILPIIAWHFIKDHNFVCIIHKCVSYLPSLVKGFRCNIYSTKFETRHLYYMFLNPSYDFSRHLR